MKLSRLLFTTTLTIASQCACAQVAEVETSNGTASYETLREAFEAGASSSSVPTIRLLSAVDLEMETLRSWYPIVLDLNGKTVLGSAANLISVEGGTLTITDTSKRQNGRIYQDCSTFGVCINVKNGTLDVAGGKIYATTSAADATICALRTEGKGNITMSGGTVEAYAVNQATAVALRGNPTKMDITGGKIVSTAENSTAFGVTTTSGATLDMNGGSITVTAGFEKCYAINASSGTINVNDGVISTDAHSFTASMYIGNNANVTINGGHFSSASKVNVLVDLQTSASADRIKVNGGYFEHELGLNRYTGTKYVTPLAVTANEYADGYRYTVSDTPHTTSIALNTVSGKYYDTLEEALASAVYGDTISLQNDYRLTADATIPNGVVLNIPFDLKNTCFTTRPQSSYLHIEEYVYRTLTLASGVTLTVDGEMAVSAEQTSTESGQWYGQGSVYGGHAFVDMEEGSLIDVNGGLYCWGYIAGKGRVNANATSTIYEAFQFMDWHGGNRSFEYVNYCYPYSQYYVQNIEVPLTFAYGARELLGTDMYFNDELHRVDDMRFIAPIEDGKSLFLMQPGSKLTKSYDGAADRLNYSISGDLTLGTLSMDYGGMALPSDVFVFPINNNMSLAVSGGTLTVPHDYALLAGATLTIEKDAAMVIDKAAKLYAYGKNDWDKYAVYYLFPLEYTIANGHKNQTIRWGGTSGTSSTAKSLVSDAVIDVKGTIKVDGNFMTTEHGASVICSQDGGKVIVANADALATATIYQPFENGFDCHPITATPAQLTNADASVVMALAQETPVCYYYKEGVWQSADFGDVNGDHEVTLLDANMIANYVSGNMPRDFNANVADVNCDGKITIEDALYIMNMFLGKKTF